MKTFKFKTNLKCNNCVAKVKSQLDEADEILNWSVDLKSPERILTVEAKNDEAVELVKQILSQVGYRSEICPD